jgi:hypothetical protein
MAGSHAWVKVRRLQAGCVQYEKATARFNRRIGVCSAKRIKRLLQGEVRFDGVLDLVNGKAEFTGRTTWPSPPGIGSPRGRYRARCGSVFVPGA